MIIKILLSWISLLTLVPGFGQKVQNIENEAEINSVYNKKMQASSNLYSGPEYIEQTYQKSGSQYFISDTLTKGWISYDSHLYTNIPLQWDVLQNYVITLSLKENARLILRNELIDSFYFAGHLIKNMPADKEHNLLNAGFYDILYEGSTPVIVLRKKQNIGIIQGNIVVYNFYNRDKIYVKKESTYYLVSNKKDILNLFSKNKPAIKRLMRKSGMSWRKNLDQAAEMAAQHYDKSLH